MKRWAGGFLLSPVFHYMSDIYENLWREAHEREIRGQPKGSKGLFQLIGFCVV